MNSARTDACTQTTITQPAAALLPPLPINMIVMFLLFVIAMTIGVADDVVIIMIVIRQRHSRVMLALNLLGGTPSVTALLNTVVSPSNAAPGTRRTNFRHLGFGTTAES